MKITFLGTSHGYAEKGRFTTSLLIEEGGHNYIIDAGAPVEALLVNRDKRLEDIRGIFVTHMHSDHVCELPSLIEPLLRYRFNDQAVCFMPEQDGVDAFLVWMKAIRNSEEKILATVPLKVITEGKIFENEDITVSAVPTRHFPRKNDLPTSWAFVIECKGKRVLFTGDMTKDFTDYPSVVRDLHYDLVISEMAHATLANVADMLKATDTDRMLITHYAPKRIADADEIFKTFPFPISFAFDGLEIDI